MVQRRVHKQMKSVTVLHLANNTALRRNNNAPIKSVSEVCIVEISSDRRQIVWFTCPAFRGRRQWNRKWCRPFCHRSRSSAIGRRGTFRRGCRARVSLRPSNRRCRRRRRSASGLRRRHRRHHRCRRRRRRRLRHTTITPSTRRRVTKSSLRPSRVSGATRPVRDVTGWRHTSQPYNVVDCNDGAE